MLSPEMFPLLFLPAWLITTDPHMAPCPQRKALMSSGPGLRRDTFTSRCSKPLRQAEQRQDMSLTGSESAWGKFWLRLSISSSDMCLNSCFELISESRSNAKLSQQQYVRSLGRAKPPDLPSAAAPTVPDHPPYHTLPIKSEITLNSFSEN